MNFKWLTFNCVSLFVAVFLIQFYDAAHLLWTLDKTHITLAILGIYMACSAYIGYMGEKADFKKVKFHSNRLTMWGLIGTMAGLILMFYGAADMEAFRNNILAEVGPVFLTGLFGLASSLALDIQIALCFDNYDD